MPPVEEVIKDGKNGLLFDFFDQSALVRQVCRVLEHPDQMAEMGQSARETVVNHYDLKRVCLPEQLRLIERITSG